MSKSFFRFACLAAIVTSITVSIVTLAINGDILVAVASIPLAFAGFVGLML